MTDDTGVLVDESLLFATVDDLKLHLDLFRPADQARPAPVAIYLHGGAWMGGNRAMDTARRAAVVARLGVAVASIDYRLGPDGTYPRAIHDVRAAVRWLRANGERWNLATDRIGAWGASAGGHLAMVAAMSVDPALEGDVGTNTDRSSAIAAVVNWFGIADLATHAARSPMEANFLPPGAESKFVGVAGGPDDFQALRAASPVALVRAGGPSLLSMHGDHDKMIPAHYSRRLHEAALAAGQDSMYLGMGAAGHEDPLFEQPFVLQLVANYLADRLADPATKPRPAPPQFGGPGGPGPGGPGGPGGRGPGGPGGGPGPRV